MTTVTQPADAYCKGTYVGAANESAATIIYKVSQACGVSPKALLVTLEKEQGLVTHTWPSSYRYDKAMGFACPDTAPCDTQYFGFQNQVWRAARQFQRYKASPASYNYRAGVPNIIRYNPNAACGSSTVVIQNQATAGLYNYTPYQPNAAALNNLYGTGDGCSAYGNRNFWRLWTDWFGDPTAPICTSAAVSDIAQYWQSRGGASGPLGAVAAPSTGTEGGVHVGYYANGDVFCLPATGPVEVMGEIRTLYRSAGGLSGSLGAPLSSPSTYTASSITGTIQYFAKGLVMSSSVSGTAAVLDGRMRTEWGNRGGAGGALGWPVHAQEAVLSGVRQRFSSGFLYVPHAGSAVVVGGVYADFWASGTTMNTIGAPTANSVTWSAQGISGSLQEFAKAMVLSSQSTGTFAVLDGPMREEWGRRGGSGGALGWPVGEQESIPGGVRQKFQGGTLTVVNGVGSVSGAPAFDAVAEITSYASANSSMVGAASGSPVAWTASGVSGYYRNFAKAMVLSSQSTGTFAVLDGPMREEWGRRGGSGGALGWPVGEQESIPGGVRQKFQGGTLTVMNSGNVSVS